MGVKKLIKRCKKKEPKAQEKLYRLFAPKLFAVSLKYCRNYQEAEDNLQEAFITIFKKIDQFEDKGSFEGWLKRITINMALQRYRGHREFQIIDEKNIASAEEIHIDEQEISLSFLLGLVQDLPDRYRMVFNLYVLDGHSHQEVSEILNVSVGTSKSNLARARQKLKKAIENRQASNQKRSTL